MGLWRGNQPWWQQGSFVEPVAPPDAEPDASPGVQVCFSRAWLPYVIGGLLQLAQPSSWATSDPSVLENTLRRATELIEQFGTAGECESLVFRLTEACVLQFSNDGGTTWTDVDGWVDFAASCFTGATGDTGATGPEGPAGPAPTFRLNDCVLQVSTDEGSTWTDVEGWDEFSLACLPPGPPSNPLDSSTTDEACSIAAYMATEVINGGIQHVVDQINLSKTLVQTVSSFLGLLFVIDAPIALTLEVAAGAFNLIQTLNLTDLQSGLDDTTYFHNVECEIYLNIVADGMITAANWAAVVTAVEAVTAPNAATGSAVAGYLDSMTATTAMFLQQQGPIYTADCSTCSTPAGCVVPTAETVGTGSVWSTAPLDGATIARSGTTGLYTGVIIRPDSTANWRIQLKNNGGASKFIGVGIFGGTLSNSGPNAGDNNWVNSILYDLRMSATAWNAQHNGSTTASGSGSFDTSELAIYWDASTTQVGFSIDGTQHLGATIGAAGWGVVIFTAFTGDAGKQIVLCT